MTDHPGGLGLPTEPVPHAEAWMQFTHLERATIQSGCALVLATTLDAQTDGAELDAGTREVMADTVIAAGGMMRELDLYEGRVPAPPGMFNRVAELIRHGLYADALTADSAHAPTPAELADLFRGPDA